MLSGRIVKAGNGPGYANAANVLNEIGLRICIYISKSLVYSLTAYLTSSGDTLKGFEGCSEIQGFDDGQLTKIPGNSEGGSL